MPSPLVTLLPSFGGRPKNHPSPSLPPVIHIADPTLYPSTDLRQARTLVYSSSSSCAIRDLSLLIRSFWSSLIVISRLVS